MFEKNIERLARYFMRSGLSGNDICKFLALDTFSLWKAAAVYSGEITNSGSISSNGTFGLLPEFANDWSEISLNINTPLTFAVNNDEILLFKPEETSEKFPNFVNQTDISENWHSYVICPSVPHSVLALMLNTVPEFDEAVEPALRAICWMVTMYLARRKEEVEWPKVVTASIASHNNEALTERQLIIKGLVTRGYTNSVIAEEIGFSESLVRQETMVIYSKLKISGRQDLL
jgi:DNA-binding CsgD family transcriptional regulator